MTVSDILKALTTLSPDELEQVSRGVAALKGIGGPVGASARIAQGKSTALESVLVIVRDVLGEKGLSVMSVAVLTRGLRMHAAALAAERLVAWAEKALPGNVNNQRALLAAGFGLLYDRLAANSSFIADDRGGIITGRTLVSKMEDVPALIDMQFPGYVAMGLARMILRPQQKGDGR